MQCSSALLQSAPLEQIVLSTSFPSVNISRASRKDKHLHSPICVLRVADIRRFVVGVIRYPSLPPFDYTMSQYQIPATPRVISPSPTPSESQEGSQDGYFGPITRSSAKKRIKAPAKIDEGVDDEESDPNPELRRARSKSREPIRVRKMSGLSEAKASANCIFQQESSDPLQMEAQQTDICHHLVLRRLDGVGEILAEARVH